MEKPRQVTAEWHLRQVMKWLEYDNGRELDNVLVYASFELRCAIERTIFENLLLVKGKLTPEEQKRCRSKEGMLDLMRESDSLYRKTFEFTKMFFSIVLGVNKIKPINTAFLSRKWHELSTYCHKLLEPAKSFQSPNRDFQKKGFKLIHKVLKSYSELEKNLGAYIRPDSMSDELRSVYERYLNDEIDDASVKRTLNIMAPILRQKMPFAKAIAMIEWENNSV